MNLEITLTLKDGDLRYFRDKFREAATRNAEREPRELLEELRGRTMQVLAGDLPEFVRQRIEELNRLTRMVEDESWQLSSSDRKRIVNALAYLAQPEDVIADNIPVLGFIDDAIVIELILQGLRHELEAYEEFTAYRDAEMERRANQGRPTDVSKADWLADRRAVLHSRMRDRRMGDASGWQNTLFSWGMD